MEKMKKQKRRFRLILEVDGKQKTIFFHRFYNQHVTQVDDPQYTHHMNNIDDAVRKALAEENFEILNEEE